MEQVTFVIEHTKDKELLIDIAEKLGIINYKIGATNERPAKEIRKELLKIIDNGTGVSNFADPSSWQRNTRKDRVFRQHLK